MAWLVFALGAALCAGGVGTVWSGISYMPVEWGWSQIIAGTTAFSAGIVTIALAALLWRLGTIHRTLLAAGTMRDTAREPESFAAPRPEPIVIQPDATPEAEPERFTERPAEPEQPTPYLRRDVAETLDHPRPARDAAADHIEDVDIVPPATVHIVPDRVPEPRPEPPARPRRAGWISPFGAKRSRPDAPPPVVSSLVDPGPPPWAVEPPETDRSDLRPAEPTALPHLEPEAEPALPEAPEPDREEPRTEPPIVIAAESEPEAPAEVPAQAANGVGVHETAEPPTVVGRYQAGGASYALFSDGTIEVETETGLHRFESMDDLKQFLERQDQTSRPGWPG